MITLEKEGKYWVILASNEQKVYLNNIMGTLTLYESKLELLIKLRKIEITHYNGYQRSCRGKDY